jgi:hypothetical protein
MTRQCARRIPLHIRVLRDGRGEIMTVTEQVTRGQNRRKAARVRRPRADLIFA